MDFLKEIPSVVMPAIKRSPFWAKTYGGYTREQLDFFYRNLGPVDGKRICDPMSGQAFSTCQMAWSGADVHLFDIMVGPLALASLRDPVLLREKQLFFREFNRTFRRLQPLRKKKIVREHCRDWISPSVADQLQEIAYEFRINLNDSPFQIKSAFWHGSPKNRFILGLLVLAARSITCFQTSDNSTWLKRGGITPGITVIQALEESFHSWESFAQNTALAANNAGSVQIDTWNCEKGIIKQMKGSMDVVLVSPPYANRLDYSLLWAPEIAVAASMFRVDASSLKAAQVGTTVVKNRWPTDKDLDILPHKALTLLQSIREDSAKASERYYYPFFANYALSLARSVESWCAMVKKRGKMLVIVRDTVRKDHLFPTDTIVREIAKRCGLRQTNFKEDPHIIRSHIGLMRHRRTKGSIHGLAQREWMLAFQK